MKIEELLKLGREQLNENNIEDASIISRVLLQHVLNLQKSELIIKQTEEVNDIEKEKYQKYIKDIISGMPLQYITNYQEFMKLPFFVNEDVLIPQPDTEILVEEVINIIKNENMNNILDICTGSGCIGISIAKYIQNCNVTMSDISPKALKIAEKNAKENNVIKNIKLVESDLFEKIEEKFDIIVSNPPYIETKVIETLSKQVQKEPIIALDGGEDGLLFYKKIIDEAPKYLKEGSYLCMEIGYDQKEKVIELIQNSKLYKEVYSKKDLEGNDRIIICKK